MTDFPPLSAGDAWAIGRIVQAVRDSAPLMRLIDDHTVKAEARMIVLSGKRPYAPGPDDDVRNCSLWVTAGAFEEFWPLAELVPELIETRFAIHQRPESPPITPVALSDAEWLYGDSPHGLRMRAAEELGAEFGTDPREWLI